MNGINTADFNVKLMERVDRRKWKGVVPEEYLRFFLSNIFGPYEEMQYINYLKPARE